MRDVGAARGGIGREGELARLDERLARARLVTIVAAGGTGKSTLVLMYADRHRATGGAAWSVDLEGVTAERAFAQALAVGLGLEVGGGDASAAVYDFLATRTGLLVLDTLEEVRGAGSWIEGLLAAAPGIRVLAASRRPLHTRSEHEFPLGGLELPVDDGPASVEASPAGALFLRHARRLGRLELLGAEDARAVAELLRRLDGLPLAIELAAGRARLLEPAGILARLRDPALLARTAADPADRHRSLAAVLDWSLALLDDAQGAMLRALSACPTPVDLALAETLSPGSSVAALDALLAAGLITEIPGRPGRYRPFDTVRTRVAEGVSAEEIEAVMERLGRFAAEVAGRHAPGLWEAGGQRDAIRALETQRDVLETAIDWAVDHEPDSALRIVADLGRFWITGSDLARPVRWLRHLLRDASPVHPSRPLAIAVLIRLLARQEGTGALALADEAVAAVEREGSGIVRRLVYGAIAHAEYARGDLHAVGTWTLRVADMTDDVHAAVGFRESGLGSLARARGEHAAAVRHLRAAAAAFSRADDALNAAIELINVSLLELRLLRPKAAAGAAGDSLRLNARGYMAAGAMCMLGVAQAESGDPTRSLETLARAWALVERGPLVDRLDVLEACVPALIARGEDGLALTALAAADALRPATGWARSSEMGWLLARSARRARRRLGTAAASSAAAAAAGLRVEPLVAQVLAIPRGTAAGPSVPRPPDDLTPREAEVLSLLVLGHSDGEIASQLEMSPKTVSVHLGRAKSKLGATSRVDLAMRAHALGLAAALPAPRPIGTEQGTE